MRFIRLQEVMDKTGLSKSTIYSKIKEGEFPMSIPIGSRAVAWDESDVEKWLGLRVKMRDLEVLGPKKLW